MRQKSSANPISGEEIVFIRDKLGLSVAQFAALLSVHPSTVHRWEGYGPEPLPGVDGVAANVLMGLRARLAQEQAQEQAHEIGQQVANALILGGALIALAAVLNWLTNDQQA